MNDPKNKMEDKIIQVLQDKINHIPSTIIKIKLQIFIKIIF